MKNKYTESEAIDMIDKTITELVYPKWDLLKAYNYYNGKRDAEQFKYLEENYGIGNPTSIQFTPLVRKHIDAIVGEYIDTAVLPKVSCKDETTITNVNREKELKIAEELYTYLSSNLQNAVLRFLDGENLTDPAVEKQMSKLIEDIDNDFISNYEMAAQNVVEYVLQSRKTDFFNKRRQLLLDLLVSGWCFYKTHPSVENNDIEIEVLSPLNTFIDRNPESPYIKNSYRCVVRRWMNIHQIINKYGKELSKDDIAKIESSWGSAYNQSTYYIRSYAGTPQYHGIDDKEIIPGFPEDNTYRWQLMPVYEVEWLEPDSNFVMQRYEGIRIGDEVYIVRGKNEKVIRSQSNPSYCGLSVNGIYYANRNNKPYSLMLACADLQDKYDLLIFYRDNVIANSGVSGDWLDISMLPTELGVTLPERIQKWVAYKKGGVALMNTAQEGRVFNNNTSFSGFDDTIKAQTIQGIEMAIERIESTCSGITGVFRERLNGINQNDAVSNVKVGAQNSYTVTKQYVQQMDLVTLEILTDCLDTAKIVWRKGLYGALVVGDKYQRIFYAAPEYFTSSDFDIHITSGSDITKDMETIKQVVVEFIQSGQVDPDTIVEALTSKSLTDLKYKVKKSLKKTKEEANEKGQMQQQIEQAQQQLQQLQGELQKAQGKIESLNESKLQMEQQKNQLENQLGWYTARNNAEYQKGSLENDKKKTDIEYAQLYDNNPYNDKVKQ